MANTIPPDQQLQTLLVSAKDIPYPGRWLTAPYGRAADGSVVIGCDEVAGETLTEVRLDATTGQVRLWDAESGEAEVLAPSLVGLIALAAAYREAVQIAEKDTKRALKRAARLLRQEVSRLDQSLLADENSFWSVAAEEVGYGMGGVPDDYTSYPPKLFRDPSLPQAQIFIPVLTTALWAEWGVDPETVPSCQCLLLRTPMEHATILAENRAHSSRPSLYDVLITTDDSEPLTSELVALYPDATHLLHAGTNPEPVIGAVRNRLAVTELASMREVFDELTRLRAEAGIDYLRRVSHRF
ncbi:MAG: SUKH-4 family immunity protein [Propionicimonas sp.]